MFVAGQQLTSLSPPKKPDISVGFFAVKREILAQSIIGVPAGYCVPVGLMVAFLQCDKRNNRGFQKIFVVRDVNPCVFLNFVI